jgi:hypothetical protein
MAQAFDIFLVDENEEDFQYHMPNELDSNGEPVPHREWTTGIDRRAMSVKGQMPTVVYGTEKPGSASGYTLAIFNWFMPPVRLGKRFRKVTLEISFSAHGPRGTADPEAQHRRRVIKDRNAADSYWHPEVRRVIPSGTSWYHETNHHSDVERGLDLELKAGFEPYVSVGPTYHWKTTGAVDATDTIKLSGEALALGPGIARPNTVRWTILENQMDRSGVPAFLRTAVLLRRRERDTGQFLGHIKVGYSISKWSDFTNKVMGTVGAIPKDAPLIFDPSPKYAVPSEKYDTLKASFGSPEAAAEIDKEFHLISFEPKGKRADDGTATTQAGKTENVTVQSKEKIPEKKKSNEEENGGDENDSEDEGDGGGVQIQLQL